MHNASDQPLVRVETLGPVLLLTLQREPQRNAMSPALVEELIHQIQSASADPYVHAVVLQGAGNGFCAGSDLGALAAMDSKGRAQLETQSGALTREMGRCVKPVIAAVHGFAIGGGLTLAAAADIVIADPASRWSLPEVPIGLFPAWGIDLVVQRIGVAAARRLSWGIDTLDGTEAHRLGLVDQLADDPRTEALALANRLAELPPVQAQAVKRYFTRHVPPADGDQAATALFLTTTETQQAAASFARFGKGKTA